MRAVIDRRTREQKIADAFPRKAFHFGQLVRLTRLAKERGLRTHRMKSDLGVAVFQTSPLSVHVVCEGQRTVSSYSCAFWEPA